jgi:hypothetical protein
MPQNYYAAIVYKIYKSHYVKKRLQVPAQVHE